MSDGRGGPSPGQRQTHVGTAAKCRHQGQCQDGDHGDQRAVAFLPRDHDHGESKAVVFLPQVSALVLVVGVTCFPSCLTRY